MNTLRSFLILKTIYFNQNKYFRIIISSVKNNQHINDVYQMQVLTIRSDWISSKFGSHLYDS